MTRTDVHRPSEITPEHYRFIEFEYLREDRDDIGGDIRWRREAIQRDFAATGGTYSHHQHGGSCHICGADAVYTALFHHRPTNKYIRTGLDCAVILDDGIDGRANAFRRSVSDARDAIAGKRKAKATLSDAGLSDAWAIFTAEAGTLPHKKYGRDDDYTIALLFEERTIRDIVRKLVQYGSISDRQTAFVGKLLKAIPARAARDAARKAENAAAQPLPTSKDRVVIEGTVLSVKAQKGYFGEETKCLVRHEDGWKVWGALPIGEKGDRVRFTARVTASDDPKFGYFKRPTKAELI